MSNDQMSPYTYIKLIILFSTQYGMLQSLKKFLLNYRYNLTNEFYLFFVFFLLICFKYFYIWYSLQLYILEIV